MILISLDGTFDANASEDEDSDEEDSTTTSGGYPEEVLKVLRTLDDGQMGPDVIKTDTGFYVVQLKEKMDKDATESKKKSIASTRQEDFYKETTEKWLDEADVTVDKKVLKTLKVTDSHKFSIVTPTPEVTEEATTTPEVTEAAEATTTPEATEAAKNLNTDSSLEVKDGDTVNIDYVGKIDGEAFDGGSTDGSGTDLVIGSGSYIDDFEDQLIGSHPGDKVEVTVTFPDDYQATDLAGKEAVFDVTVNGIYE